MTKRGRAGAGPGGTAVLEEQDATDPTQWKTTRGPFERSIKTDPTRYSIGRLDAAGADTHPLKPDTTYRLTLSPTATRGFPIIDMVILSDGVTGPSRFEVCQ